MELDIYQRRELEKILIIACDEDSLADAISVLIHDRDASQRLLSEIVSKSSLGFAPCASVKLHSGELHDIAVIIWTGSPAPVGSILYMPA